MRNLITPSVVAVVSGVAVAAAAAHGSATPTPSTCASAWNKSAPSTLRSTLLAGSPAAKAFVVGGGTSPVCEIFFTLGNGKLVMTHGSWNGGSVRVWQPLEKLTSAIKPVPSNAAVATNGTISFKG
ncbi:MAG: hypothetical protein WCH31_06825 [Actinomycetes bacterium]